jgi:diaminohydroxyphosphoribosylaminopyrimidine deaminase/5-amino-6-(5-phosphoribosylamino)uracil reductase
MRRCLDLSLLGSGAAAPNPMVGAVLVHGNRIIGEGYHRRYGEAHAEPNCIHDVSPEDRHLIPGSTLYVSLEPCVHFGKTPPCADLIIDHKIPRVVVGCRDPFVQVNGKGIEKLRKAGIAVETGILEKDCMERNKRFFTFHTQHRPYIVLKWAQTLDGKIGPGISGNAMPAGTPRRLLISNEYTNRIVHKWRSEEMGIVVGTNTALFDDPELTTRLWPGRNPVRIVVDMDLRLPESLKLFRPEAATVVFNLRQHSLQEQVSFTDLNKTGPGYYQVTEKASLIHQMVHALYRMNIQSVLVEGGASLLQSFIDEGIWDEARIITNEELNIGQGLPAPILKDFSLEHSERVFSDVIHTYRHLNAAQQT